MSKSPQPALCSSPSRRLVPRPRVGEETRSGRRAGPRRAGRGLAVAPAKPRPSDQPPAPPLESVGGGSEGPTSRHQSPPHPVPAHVFGFSRSLRTQGKETPGADTEPLDEEKASPPASPPAGLVTSPEVGPCGSALEPLAPSSPCLSAALEGRRKAARLCGHPRYKVLQ